MSYEVSFGIDPLGSAFVLGRAWEGEQLDRVVTLQRRQAALAAEELRVLVALLDGLEAEAAESQYEGVADAERWRDLQRRSLAAELAAATRTPVSTVERRLAEAWVLVKQLPATLAALEAGEVSPAHARAMVMETEHLGAARSRVEQALLPWSMKLTVAGFRRKAVQLLDRLEKEPLRSRHERAFAKRSVQLSPARDGMARLEAYIDAADAVVIKTGLDNAVQDARRAGDDRTAGQLQADIAVGLLLEGRVAIGAVRSTAIGGMADEVANENSVDESGTDDSGSEVNGTDDVGINGINGINDIDVNGAVRTASVKERAPVSVAVLIPAATLAGEDEEAGVVPGFGMIDPEAARRLVALAPSLRRILTDPITNSIVDFDRTHYRVPAELKRIIALRDGRCRGPACDAPLGRTEVDHTIPWEQGGGTSQWNLAHLCANHHHLKHEAGWGLRQHLDGVLEWHSPTGHVYRSYPELELPGPRARVDPWSLPDERGEHAPFDLPREKDPAA
ncbi:MAG TPA: DUF222 domain-containing protein [Gryllotalpicola sp.]